MALLIAGVAAPRVLSLCRTLRFYACVAFMLNALMRAFYAGGVVSISEAHTGGPTPPRFDAFYRHLPVLLEAKNEMALREACATCCEYLGLERADFKHFEITDWTETSQHSVPDEHIVAAPALPSGQIALAFVFRGDVPLAPSLETAVSMLAFAIGRTIHRVQVNPRQGSLLSPREADCLAWIGRGKTSWEIGCILGITERTVRFHVKNAASKLGVEGRHQAVLRATARGLLAGYPLKQPKPASPQRKQAHAPRRYEPASAIL